MRRAPDREARSSTAPTHGFLRRTVFSVLAAALLVAVIPATASATTVRYDEDRSEGGDAAIPPSSR